jgi:hypothetical protein
LIDIDNAILANARFLSQMVANPEIFMGGLPEHDEDEVDGQDGEPGANGAQSSAHQEAGERILSNIASPRSVETHKPSTLSFTFTFTLLTRT